MAVGDNMPEIPKSQEDWIACIELPEYLKIIPAGCIRPIVGPIIWIDGNGTQMSTDAYISKYGIDPQQAWDAIKEYRRLNGPGVKVVK